MRAPVGHINLFNPGLMPAKKSFSARSVTVWISIAVVAMIAVAWWAYFEKESVSKQLEDQKARRAAEAGSSADVPTLQQISALEMAVHAKQSTLEQRRAQRDALKRGMAAEGGGPSQTLRLLAASIPGDVWITALTARGDHLEISGRTINPVALADWMNRLGDNKYFAAKPISAVKLENAEFSTGASADGSAPAAPRGRLSVYSFSITAQLALPFADDGARAP